MPWIVVHADHVEPTVARAAVDSCSTGRFRARPGHNTTRVFLQAARKRSTSECCFRVPSPATPVDHNPGFCGGGVCSPAMQRLRILALLIAIVAAVFALVSCGGSSHGSAGRQCVKGGAEVVFEAVPSRGQTLNHAQMQTARRIMVNRLHKLGVRSPNVALRRSDEIVIQLSGVRNPAKAAAIVGSTGQLQFFDFERDLVRPTVSYGNPTPYPTLYSLLAAADANTTMGTPEAYYLFDSRTKATEKNVVLAGP